MDVAEHRLSKAFDSLNVELLSIDRRNYFATHEGPALSLVFLDTDHPYEATLEDIRWAQTVGATVVSGDDYGAAFPGVIRVVEECGGARDIVKELFVMHTS